MKRGVVIKKEFSAVLCHVRAMLYIRRGIYVSRRTGSEDEERERRADSQVIVRGNHVRVMAFYLKSVTKRSNSSNSARGRERKGDRKREQETPEHN